MRPQSAKAKGRRFQQEVVATIKKAFPHLRDNDVQSISMGANGEDIVLSPAAEDVFAYSVECKNVERLNIWAALEQSTGNAPRGKTPILAIRRNRQVPHAVIPWGHFMDLVACYVRHRATPTKKELEEELEEEFKLEEELKEVEGESDKVDAAPAAKRRRVETMSPAERDAELRECVERMHALLDRPGSALRDE